MAKIKGTQLKLKDNQFEIIDDGDETKKLDFELTNITTATTRTSTIQDQDGVVSVQADQTLTQGSIPFSDATGKIAQDNTNFFYDDTNNRLGIGTATPGTLLQVAGLTTIGISTILADSIFINGNMGVGIDKLVIFGDDAVIGLQKSPHIIIHNEDKTTDNSGFIAWTSDNNTNNEVAYAAIDGIAGVRTSDWFAGELAFYTRTTLTNTLDERMRIDSTGNVGIGTNAPTTTLDILGDSLLTNTATADNQMASQYMLDAAGFSGFKGINMVYTTGAIVGGDRQSAFLIDIDASLATGGMFVALDVATIPGSSSVCAVEASAQVQPLLHLSGGFTNMDSALVNAIDRLTEFTSPGSDIAMFVADDDIVTIGNAAKFQQMSFDLDTVASGAGIAPTFEFSTGVGTWAVFSPSDGTNGMRNSGNIIWRDSDIPSWAVGTGTEFLIRITRTRNSLSTSPIENLVQISSITEYAWGEDGLITAAGLDLGFTTPVTSILDEDTLVSDSATALATQQSIKAYVDNTLAANDTFIEHSDTPASYTAGSVLFTSGSAVTEDNDQLFWNDTDKGLAIGSTTTGLTVNGVAVTVGILTHLDGTDNLGGLGLIRYSSTGTIPTQFAFGRTRGTLASPTVVADDDNLGRISFSGYDGTDFASAATINVEVDGTPGNDDMPGRIVFLTSPDGSQTPAEHMRITQDGLTGIGTAAPGSKLHVSGGASGVTVGATTVLTIEDDATAVMSLVTPNTGLGAIAFGDPEEPVEAFIQYIHSTDTMSITTGGASLNTALTINPTDIIINPSAIDRNFRVSGDTDTNLLFTDAGNDRVGIGTGTPVATLDVNGGIAMASRLLTDSNATAAVTDHTIEFSTGASNRTVTLPTIASSIGLILNIVKVDSGVGEVIIDGDGAETINGAATLNVVNQYDVEKIHNTGTEWRRI